MCQRGREGRRDVYTGDDRSSAGGGRPAEPNGLLSLSLQLGSASGPVLFSLNRYLLKGCSLLVCGGEEVSL